MYEPNERGRRWRLPYSSRGVYLESRSLRVHVSLVEQLIDYTRHILFQNRLEMEQRAIIGDEIPMAYLLDTIYRKDSVHLTLRMMCLKSVAEGGIKEKDLELLWKEFLQVACLMAIMRVHQ